MLKFVALGILQGFTEFLPVSSSGHLVLAEHFLKINSGTVFLAVVLHLGTLLALAVYFFREIIKVFRNSRMLMLIAVVTIITGVFGLTFKKIFESFFDSPRIVASFLIVNGFILLSTKFFKEKKREPGLLDAAVMGLAQSFAITPGLSRSGLTITSLLARGIQKEEAFKFSFIASIPAIILAFLLEFKETPALGNFRVLDLLVGIMVSFACGFLALCFLNKMIKNQKLYLVGYYCLLSGTTFLFLLKDLHA